MIRSGRELVIADMTKSKNSIYAYKMLLSRYSKHPERWEITTSEHLPALKYKRISNKYHKISRERYHEIIYLREVLRLTLQEVGDTVGLTGERVRQITMPLDNDL